MNNRTTAQYDAWITRRHNALRQRLMTTTVFDEDAFQETYLAMRETLSPDTAGDWFISKTDSPDGLSLRLKKNGGWAKNDKASSFTLYFCNRFIAQHILATVKAKKAATLLVSAKPVQAEGLEWFKVVTAKPLRIN